ncbi:MAG TPA: hypothetical protein PKD28_00975 [Candidatus Saccharibacteria bacterium]|nr:hypothetical protein [Candidatus Saccharibacteria bacterium]
MFIVGLLGWWYGAGWRERAQMIGERLMKAYDFFSLDLLLKTLFAPFRQISAGKIRGGLDAQIRAFFDRLLSRCIGATVRLIMLIVGTVWTTILAVLGLIEGILWLFVPLLPIIGAVMFAIGWVPHAGL